MNNALETLALNFYEQTLVDRPTTALMQGDHRYDDLMEDLSRGAEDDRIAFLDQVVAKAEAIEPTELTASERVTRDVLIFEAETEAGELRSRMAEFGVDPVSGFHVVFLQLVGQLPITEPEHAEAMITKFSKFGNAFDQAIARLRQGLATERVPVAVLCDRVIGQIDGYLASPIDADPFIHLPAPQEWDDAAIGMWRDRLKDVVATTIRPAYERLRTAIRDEVLPKARPEDRPGLRWLPDGEETYARAIHRHTSLKMAPLDIHNIGLEEIASLESEYAELGSKVLGTSDLDDIYRRLREDTGLRFETAEQVKQAGADSLARAKAAMADWFGRLPQADCVMAEIPIGGSEAPLAFYLPPSTDGARPGTFFVNTNDPETKTRYESEALAFHESIPGHHLQLSISQELEGIPDFRKHAFVNAYIEGWGLYTERLADEMGLYSSDIARMGILSFDSWRAGRLVVDTGIHALGWSRQEAIDYLAANSPQAMNNIVNEVDRYIAWPGQALGYKMGQREFFRVRRLAEERLGEAFDVKAFHDTVLGSGPVPLDTLGHLVEAWIDSHG